MGRILPAYVDGFLVCSRRALRAVSDEGTGDHEQHSIFNGLLVISDSLVTPPPAVGRRANSR